MLEARPYQAEALDALDAHLSSGKGTAPLVSIPTGGGKSLIIALAIQRWKAGFPPLRVMVLAHRKELVGQNSAELLGADPTCDMGIYSAGLNRRDTDNAIIYASIDSVYNKAGEFPPFDVIIIDEAHRIPLRGEGKYRNFLRECKRWNERLVIVGLTATPFRMEGPICHVDHILQEMVYEAHVSDLIADGYLCKLRSKLTECQPDLTNVRKSRGDYVVSSLSETMDNDATVRDAVRELVKHCDHFGRKAVVVFCIDVEHCKHISMELRRYGMEAPYVTAKTPARERDRIVEDFKAGKYRFLLNVNVYTEGFNAKRVDCVALLRPTLSKALYVQMVGRGLRLFPGKDYCMVLDFAHCIEEHGPIDAPDDREVRLKDCEECGDVFSALTGQCPNCGWKIPPGEKRQIEEESERERRLHEVQASNREILATPEWVDVDDVTVHLHRKEGSPDSLRLQYRSGVQVVSEWVCLDHPGFAGTKARQWWTTRALGPVPTVADAVGDMFLGQRIAERTKRILIAKSGKYWRIYDYELKFNNQQNQHD
jgi:DNA repair protein RadD